MHYTALCLGGAHVKSVCLNSPENKFTPSCLLLMYGIIYIYGMFYDYAQVYINCWFVLGNEQ